MIQTKKKPVKGVYLAGFDASGSLVYEQRLDKSKYWERRHPVIDDEEFRRSRSIVRLTCTLYDDDGGIEEQCENRYDGDGKLISL
jgi:hypothetical protein